MHEIIDTEINVRSRVYTGSRELDDLLNIIDRFYLIYGEPGSGKTNLVSKITRESLARGSRVVYICTEGSVNIEPLIRDPNVLDKDLLIVFPKSLSELLLSVLEIFSLDQEIIVIDSINHLYRIEGGYSHRSNEIFTSIVSLLHYLSRNEKRFVFATAQVRETEEGLEPSGIAFLEFYKPYKIRVSKRSNNFFEMFLERDNKIFRFYINRNNDLIWSSLE